MARHASTSHIAHHACTPQLHMSHLYSSIETIRISEPDRELRVLVLATCHSPLLRLQRHHPPSRHHHVQQHRDVPRVRARVSGGPNSSMHSCHSCLHAYDGYNLTSTWTSQQHPHHPSASGRLIFSVDVASRAQNGCISISSSRALLLRP